MASITSASVLRQALEFRGEQHQRLIAEPEVVLLRRTRQLEVQAGAQARQCLSRRSIVESRLSEWAARQRQIPGALAFIGSFDPEAAKQADDVALIPNDTHRDVWVDEDQPTTVFPIEIVEVRDDGINRPTRRRLASVAVSAPYGTELVLGLVTERPLDWRSLVRRHELGTRL